MLLMFINTKEQLIDLIKKDIEEIKGEFHYNEEFKRDCEAKLLRLEKEVLEKIETNTGTMDYYDEIGYTLEEWIAWYCLS